MDAVLLSSVFVNVSVVVFLVILILLCLKIKTTKKTPELLGTVGTVKTFDEDGLLSQHNDTSTNLSVQHQLNISHNSTGPLVIVPPPSAPSPASHGNPSSVGHSPAASPYYQDHNRTPSRAGERKLPEIPHDSDNGSTSELYDTLGPVPRNREASDSETETDGARANHPYARVKKRNAREHPYATVTESANRASHGDDIDNSLKVDNADGHLLQASQNVPTPPPPLPENAAQAHFSGDSQDSCKGYTSISVREPLCHIQPHGGARATSDIRPNATYVAVSEASDDMYAAIEDPTYIPTGAVSQTNSDTYAVINPDYDSGSQTYQKLQGQYEEDDESSSPQHTYSKIDKSKKKRASAPPPLPPPPLHPDPISGAGRPTSFNIDDMYAKIHKTTSPRSESHEGAIGPRLTPRSTRARSAHWDENTRRVQRGEVNYSDFEVSHFDPNHAHIRNPVGPLGSQEFMRSRNSAESGSNLAPSNLDGGYETVPDLDTPNSRIEGLSSGSLPMNEHGYQSVVGEWLRRPPGSVVTSPFDAESGLKSLSRNREHGYETVQEAGTLVGYPHLRHGNTEVEPPYAVLNSRESDEESEEGYETIPPERRPGVNEEDPGYESVKKKESVISHGYEVISEGKLASRRRSSKRDPGYETVKERPGFNEHDYETVPGVVSKKVSTATDYGYEQVDNLHRRLNDFGTVVEREPPSLPQTTVHIGHESLPPALPYPALVSSISLSPKLEPPPRPVPHSPSVRPSVFGPISPHRTTRKSSRTVIELRNDEPFLREKNDNDDDDDDDDDTVNSGNEGAEVNSHIFV